LKRVEMNPLRSQPHGSRRWTSSGGMARRTSRPNLHIALGNVLHSQGKLDEAIAEYREAIRTARTKPHLALAHVNLGRLLLDQGALDEAIAAGREAIRPRQTTPPPTLFSEAPCERTGISRQPGRNSAKPATWPGPMPSSSRKTSASAPPLSAWPRSPRGSRRCSAATRSPRMPSKRSGLPSSPAGGSGSLRAPGSSPSPSGPTPSWPKT
jgi:hypothetical protein